MAARYGEESDLVKEIEYYLAHQPFGAKVTKWSLEDFLSEARNNVYTKEEFETAIKFIEEKYGVTLEDGSLAESIGCMKVPDMVDELKTINMGAKSPTKIEELEMNIEFNL